MGQESEQNSTPLTKIQQDVLREAAVHDAKTIVEGTPGFKPDMYDFVDTHGNIDLNGLAQTIDTTTVPKKSEG